MPGRRGASNPRLEMNYFARRSSGWHPFRVQYAIDKRPTGGIASLSPQLTPLYRQAAPHFTADHAEGVEHQSEGSRVFERTLDLSRRMIGTLKGYHENGRIPS